MTYQDKSGDTWPDESVYLQFKQRGIYKETNKDFSKTIGRHGRARRIPPCTMCNRCEKRKATTTTYMGEYVCLNCHLDIIL